MNRSKWTTLLAVGTLLFASSLALRRAGQAPAERKGYCLDWAADAYGLFDRFVGLPFRKLEIRMAGIGEGNRVLDLGCGPGTLTLLEKETVGRRGYVAAIDIGPKMIAKAREQAARRGLDIDFRVAGIDALPFSRDTFDIATSSFMVHHLPTEIKQAGFREVHRILKPGGHYLIVDFPAVRGLLGKVTLAIAHLLGPIFDEANDTLDLLKGKVPQMLEDAGFAEIEEIRGHRLGGIIPIAFIRARKGRA